MWQISRYSLLLLVFYQCWAFGLQDYEIKVIADSSSWRRLMMYRNKFGGSIESQITNSSFFFSGAQGRIDPVAELKASVRAFQNHDSLACQYPARARFLKEMGALSIRNVHCPKLQKAFKNLSAKSLSLVYAAGFFGNAASTFGHIFLRINGTTPTVEIPHLLNYGLNYSALPQTNDLALVFALRGLFGGYNGRFSAVPYYEKIKEYSDFEERDLWEYDLSFTPDQTMRLIEIVWDLQQADIPYYFLKENCAFQILTLLETANPKWSLTDKFNLWILPQEAVQIVASTPGAIKKISYRPSLQSNINVYGRLLSTTERKKALAILKGEQAITGNESAAFLDFILNLQKLGWESTKQDFFQSQQQLYQKTLIARSKIATSEEESADSMPYYKRPDLAGGSQKISIFQMRYLTETYWGFQYRPAIHDLFDDDRGQMPFSEFILLSPTVAMNTDKKWRLRSLDIVEVVSLNPYDEFTRKISWSVYLGFREILQKSIFHVSTGAGYTQSLFNGTGVTYGLLKMNVDQKDKRRSRYSIGPSVQLGWIKTISQKIKLGMRIEDYWIDCQEDSRLSELDMLTTWQVSRDFELRLNLLWWKSTRTFFEGKAFYQKQYQIGFGYSF